MRKIMVVAAVAIMLIGLSAGTKPAEARSHFWGTVGAVIVGNMATNALMGGQGYGYAPQQYYTPPSYAPAYGYAQQYTPAPVYTTTPTYYYPPQTQFCRSYYTVPVYDGFGQQVAWRQICEP